MAGPTTATSARDSATQAFTQHNPQPCLTADDVEGIATLYPDCSEHGISRVVCHKVRHNIGVVRIAVHKPTGKPYALKALHKGHLISTNQVIIAE